MLAHDIAGGGRVYRAPEGLPSAGRVLVLALAMFVAPACGAQPGGTEARDADPPMVTVALPPGDAVAGWQAIVDLRCNACHLVPSEPELPAPVSAIPGPDFDARVGARDVSYLLASVMTPSHAMSKDVRPDVREHLDGVLSPMGDFSRVMTVRQLIDIHAYLRSLK